MHGQESARYTLEFALDAFLGRVQDNAGTLAEQHLLDLNKSE
jgi:hypothetical protein